MGVAGSKDGSDGSEGSEGKEGGSDRVAVLDIRTEDKVKMVLPGFEMHQREVYNPKLSPLQVFHF